MSAFNIVPQSMEPAPPVPNCKGNEMIKSKYSKPIAGDIGLRLAKDLALDIRLDKDKVKHQITLDCADRSIIKLKGFGYESSVWFLINALGTIAYQTRTILDVMEKTNRDYSTLKKWHEKALRHQLSLTEIKDKGVRGANR